MARYLITGGRQRPSRFVRREEWNSFEKAVLIELDTDTGKTRTLLEYQSPPANCPTHEPSFIFKSASWDGDRLLLCTQTEVLVFEPRSGRIVETISHPWFNDVHYVCRIQGRLHVVSTGLDAVFVLDSSGAVVETHSATGNDPWKRFDTNTDYRKVSTTKPHQSHPNYLFEAAGSRWVTRFEQKDALALDAALVKSTAKLAEQPIHDGLVVGDAVWFTVVSGQVVKVNPFSGAILASYDLNSFKRKEDVPLGWCRGIFIESEQRVVLGFSRLRPTLFVQNLSWLRAPLNRPEPEPARVAVFDLESRRELQSWNMEEAGLSAVCSILPANSGG